MTSDSQRVCVCLGRDKTVLNQTMVIAAQLYEYTANHSATHLKQYVDHTLLYELYLNKATYTPGWS